MGLNKQFAVETMNSIYCEQPNEFYKEEQLTMELNSSTNSKQFAEEKPVRPEVETMNSILNELKTLNNNFKKMEKTIQSRQQMYPPMYPIQQSANPLSNILNNLDFEKVLRTISIISSIYKSQDEE